MANLVQVECNHILDASSGTTVYLNPTTPIKVALCTAVGSSTAAGTEVELSSVALSALSSLSVALVDFGIVHPIEVTLSVSVLGYTVTISTGGAILV